ncbi:putative protein-S-isoprenylcysteine methyltransferase [Longilinea arvoryzae]|uniref:Isoprenylcysteine carboxylmethyltransferase family protein n=1 Tax=Longilinea arvoryzae TaxID=360412 RepID=A0A0K8MY90_9CHLR|nr:isoprenylcysteine carboxylmethyltransferase family protein [Longilinea arvoryzae]GAP16001.1 putative protein-S-isoprenylcysteine methyltransferase [Longilinea arvoryzae]
MNAELTFRIVFWAQLMFIMIFNRVLPALRAKKSGVKLTPDHEAIENEGKFWFVFRVIAGILLAAALVFYSFFPIPSSRFQFPIPYAWRWAGVILSSICLFFWIYAQEILDRYWSVNLKIQKEHRLVTSGPYRVMRHPIYSAMIFWSAGLALDTAHAIFAAFAVVVILWTAPRISKEEKMLIEHFGAAYLDYMKTTGRFLPKFKRH